MFRNVQPCAHSYIVKHRMINELVIQYIQYTSPKGWIYPFYIPGYLRILIELTVRIERFFFFFLQFFSFCRFVFFSFFFFSLFRFVFFLCTVSFWDTIIDDYFNLLLIVVLCRYLILGALVWRRHFFFWPFGTNRQQALSKWGVKQY